MKKFSDWVAPKSLYRLGSVEIGTGEDGIMYWEGLEKDAVTKDGYYEVHGHVTSIGNLTILQRGVYSKLSTNYEHEWRNWVKELTKLPRYYQTRFYVREFDGNRSPSVGDCLDGSIDLKDKRHP